MKKPIKPPPASKSVPEVFIIESLTVADEVAERFEGKIIWQILRLCGKKPAYYYCRSEAELKQCADLFTSSGYRYLHISSHGSDSAIYTTLDEIPFADLATIFKNKLKNRRLFVSACDVGSGFLTSHIRENNKGMYSIACPMDDIQFDRAAAIWAAFYVRMFDEDASSMKSSKVAEILTALGKLFSVRFNWAVYNAEKDIWKDKILE